MKKQFWVTAVFISLCLAFPAFGSTIKWQTYREGMHLAQKERKKVFLHFKTEWCRYCRQMNETTFLSPKVVDYLNQYYVSIKVDGDEQAALARTYGVNGYPDNIFLDEKGKKAYQRPGFLNPEVFHLFLEYVESNAYKTMDPMQYYQSR